MRKPRPIDAKPSSHGGTCCQMWNRLVAGPTCTCRFASVWSFAASIRAATGVLSLRIAPSESLIDRRSLTRRGALLQQCDGLDVRRVREHVNRRRAEQLVAVLLAEPLPVAGQRRRVTGDVDDARRADLAEPAEHLAREPG